MDQTGDIWEIIVLRDFEDLRTGNGDATDFHRTARLHNTLQERFLRIGLVDEAAFLEIRLTVEMRITGIQAVCPVVVLLEEKLDAVLLVPATGKQDAYIVGLAVRMPFHYLPLFSLWKSRSMSDFLTLAIKPFFNTTVMKPWSFGALSWRERPDFWVLSIIFMIGSWFP